MEQLRESHKDKDFSRHDSIRGRGLFLIISQLVDTLYFKDNEG
jgi:anti-sigma regulatory factor (Ser/Thr protein kinase)